MVKTALKATFGQCLASPDELCTVFCEVKARVNDRPLTFVRSDVQEEMALTPAHVLIARSLAAFPDRSDNASRGTLSSSLRHLLRRWSYQRKPVDVFWKRWQREYEQFRHGDVNNTGTTIHHDVVDSLSDRGVVHWQWWAGQARSKTAAGIFYRSISTLVLLEQPEVY
ncbi:hypothetical protein T4E_2244 [Trichinella pseudospiralis]|uniref:DUF5641 domain-containing protein n=1 Tax=Trichinella pseudospiralis TaxID=6337 RepID=A0A0V0YGY7_TRIPS|nr:hypothetical protein T4E_2244 [Trichinella pseudospiralis]